MDLMLYDTYERRLRPFDALQPGHAGLYACGPTVYDYAHIGNLRTYLFGDLLRRVLQLNNYDVKHVVNITDVGHLTSDADSGEDKMEKGSRRTGRSAWDIAAFYTAAFQRDLERLRILPPAVWARATDHIPEQIAFILEIERAGFAYHRLDGIYFDTARLERYGHLARLDIAGLRAGHRVDVGDKRAPTDFALWKFSGDGEQRQMEWDSPWGRGFPGWHIECSAMSTRYLGALFDIHIGGEDHVPVHHSNEIAQHEACHGHPPARYWLHGSFLRLADSEKMSKSDGSFIRLDSLIGLERTLPVEAGIFVGGAGGGADGARASPPCLLPAAGRRHGRSCLSRAHAGGTEPGPEHAACAGAGLGGAEVGAAGRGAEGDAGLAGWDTRAGTGGVAARDARCARCRAAAGERAAAGAARSTLGRCGFPAGADRGSGIQRAGYGGRAGSGTCRVTICAYVCAQNRLAQRASIPHRLNGRNT
jgi:hypothetical protein